MNAKNLLKELEELESSNDEKLKNEKRVDLIIALFQDILESLN